MSNLSIPPRFNSYSKKAAKAKYIAYRVKRFGGRQTIPFMAKRLEMSSESLYYWVHLLKLPFKDQKGVNNHVDKKESWVKQFIG